MNNKPEVDFDHYTDNYNRLLNEQTRFFSNSETYFAKYKINILLNHAPEKPKRLLEYGCGIGRNIPFLREAFPGTEIMGSDISAASLEVARVDNPGIEFFLEGPDIYPNGRFDVIFVAGVFHHIPVLERNRVMDLLFKRLTPGGTLIVFEHNALNPVTRKIVNDCPYDKGVVLLRVSELRRMMVKAGLADCKSGYCLFIPPSLPRLLFLESKLQWLPLGGQYWIKATKSV